MHKTTIAVLLCSLLIITTALPLPVAGQTSGTTFDKIISMPDAGYSKFPRITASGNTLHISASSGQKATIWTKADTADSFNPSQTLGDASNGNKKDDYANTTVFSGADGAVYAVWISQFDGIYMRKKPAGGDWEAAKLVARAGASQFRSYVHGSVASDNSLMVVWNESSAVHYRFSNNGGASWSGAVASSLVPNGQIFLAAGPGRPFTATYSNQGKAILALFWNGSGWTTETVSQGGVYKADPCITISPNGKIYVSWREVGGNLYIAERQDNGGWNARALVKSESFGYVWIHADAQNNLHAAWAGNASGDWDYWYAYRPVGGDWEAPVRVAGNGAVVANLAIHATIGARVYAHVVGEFFSNSGSAELRYLRFSSQGGASAKAVIEDGTSVTNKSSLSVKLTDLQGSPNQVRYHWDSAPTDSDTWETFDSANPVLSVAAPTDVSAGACQTRRLYVQVRKDEGFAGAASSSAITFDTGVQANIQATNLYIPALPLVSTNGLRIQDTFDQQGAWNGAPNYTRSRQIYLSIRDSGDCSGLADFTVENSIAGTISGSFGGIIPLPGDTAVGPKQLRVTVTDKLNNSTTYPAEIIYDPRSTTPITPTNSEGLPVVSDTVTGTVSADNSILRTLSFSGVSVTDNLYGKQAGENLPDGKQFWGVWVANSTSDVAPDDPSLNYYAVRVDAPDSSFSVPWNLFNGLNYGPATDKSGTYYIYVRFLDGAGNPSTTAVKLQTQLAPGYSLPRVALPVVRRARTP